MPQDPEYIGSGATTLRDTRNMAGGIFGLLGSGIQSGYEGVKSGLGSVLPGLAKVPGHLGYQARQAGRALNNVVPQDLQPDIMDLLVNTNPMLAGLTADYRNPAPANPSQDDEMALLLRQQLHNHVTNMVSKNQYTPGNYMQLDRMLTEAQQRGFNPTALTGIVDYIGSKGKSGTVSGLTASDYRVANTRPARRGEPGYVPYNPEGTTQSATMPGMSAAPFNPYDTILRGIPFAKAGGMGVRAALGSKNPVVSNLAKRATFYGTKQAVKGMGKKALGAVTGKAGTKLGL